MKTKDISRLKTTAEWSSAITEAFHTGTEKAVRENKETEITVEEQLQLRLLCGILRHDVLSLSATVEEQAKRMEMLESQIREFEIASGQANPLVSASNVGPLVKKTGRE